VRRSETGPRNPSGLTKITWSVARAVSAESDTPISRFIDESGHRLEQPTSRPPPAFSPEKIRQAADINDEQFGFLKGYPLVRHPPPVRHAVA
jgi:hypothetical protein